MSLPTDDKSRKNLPIFRGPLMYFPDALLEVAAVCKAGNDQHNPGEPLHWARGKSMEQMDTALRHMMDHGLGTTKDTDGRYHMAKAAWRCLAELQLTIERERANGANGSDMVGVCPDPHDDGCHGRCVRIGTSVAETTDSAKRKVPREPKVGDRVRVIDDGSLFTSDHPPGSVGVITCIDSTHCTFPYYINFDRKYPELTGSYTTWYTAAQIEVLP